MNLSENEYDLLAKTIIKRAGQFRCPVCGQHEGFNVSDNEFHLISGDATPTGLNLGGNMDYLKLIALTCGHCGHVEFFNRITLERLAEK